MKSSALQSVLSQCILKFTDIQEDFLCRFEAEKIRHEVETALARLKRGLIGQQEFEKVLIRNQKKLDDVLIR